LVTIPKEELVPGRRYLIIFGDCCVSGELTGTYRGIDPKTVGAKEHNQIHHFDFGLLFGERWTAVEEIL
jgi:hypothetical protein